jgi:hypothetical protein
MTALFPVGGAPIAGSLPALGGAVTGTIAATEDGDRLSASGSTGNIAVQVLNYGVWRRLREEYERLAREEEAEERVAREIAAAIDEGLPEEARPVDEPEPEPLRDQELAAASFAQVTAAIASRVEERVLAALSDDDEEAALILLLAT